MGVQVRERSLDVPHGSGPGCPSLHTLPSLPLHFRSLKAPSRCVPTPCWTWPRCQRGIMSFLRVSALPEPSRAKRGESTLHCRRLYQALALLWAKGLGEHSRQGQQSVGSCEMGGESWGGPRGRWHGLAGIVRDLGIGSLHGTWGGERWLSPLAALWRKDRQGQKYRWGGQGVVSLVTGRR